MKIYTVEIWCGHTPDTVGVFSNYDKAKKHVAYIDKSDEYYTEDDCMIKEFELDDPSIESKLMLEEL